VRWFKDGHLLLSEAEHLDQTGSELMFFTLSENDSGDYHCEASNYLGSVQSDRFTLNVQSSKYPLLLFTAPNPTSLFSESIQSAYSTRRLSISISLHGNISAHYHSIFHCRSCSISAPLLLSGRPISALWPSQAPGQSSAIVERRQL